MIGYHYTSYQNWLNIMNKGLRLQHIDKPELKKWFPDGVDGVWVWERELSPIDELGSVLWQLQSKTRTKIVKLEIEFHYGQWLYWHDPETHSQMSVSLTHTGVMGDYLFHPGSPVARILTEPVLPENIKLVRVFELLDLVKPTGGKKTK